MHFFPLLSVFLSLLTVVHLFLLITRSKVHHLTHKDIARASALLVLLALFCSLAPLITDQYGRLGT
jgi:phosphatidylserine synthase